MIVFFYEKVRLKRGVWQTVSIVLLIAFLCAFFTLFDGFICQKEQDMESAYAVIPVTVVVSNLTGTKTDDLKITDYIINYFLSDKYAYGGELQEKAFSSYVKDVCLKASVYYSQGTGFSSRQKLIGITSVDAASELAPVSGNSITYFEGYDESIFTSNKAVCLVSTAAAEELSQDGQRQTQGGNCMTPLKQLFRQPVRLFAIFLLVGMASAFICLSAGVFASAKATLAQIEERYVTIGVPTTETADVATEYNGLTLHHEESVISQDMWAYADLEDISQRQEQLWEGVEEILTQLSELL